MSNILDSEDFGLKLYNRFPPKYREDDVDQNFALKRYLQSLSDGGYKYVIEEINGITSLVDPFNVDASILPILYKQYGLEIFNGIPELYLRYLLPRLGEAWSMKGSIESIEFITTAISGIKSLISISYDSLGNPYVSIKLEVDYNMGDYVPDNDQLKKLLVFFIPFYCDMAILYSYVFYDDLVLSASEEVESITIHDTKIENGVIRTKNLEHSGTSAMLGEAVLGEAVLDDEGVTSDSYFKDYITEAEKTDSKILVTPIDSLTNTTYNKLNGSFFTNGMYCYDIITTSILVDTGYLGEAVLGESILGKTNKTLVYR